MPLRFAGQSLEEKRRALLNDKILPIAAVAAAFAAIAVMEWVRYFGNARPDPAFFTAMAIPPIAACAWQLLRFFPQSRTLRHVIQGEKAVGRYLEQMRTRGYDVFHDIVAADITIDHALVGPAGVYTIETKTWTSAARGEILIGPGAKALVAGNHWPERDPVARARAQATWLKKFLAEDTGREFEVRPVVLVPGWPVEASENSRRHTWVLEPQALPAFLEREPLRLAPADQELAGLHLSLFVRSVEKERARGLWSYDVDSAAGDRR
jgi:hypothetical protein